MTAGETKLQELQEELELLRSGKPYHVHRWFVGADERNARCTSPYCSSLTNPPGKGENERA